jgi:lipoprotein-releasing system ATP-binding protein
MMKKTLLRAENIHKSFYYPVKAQILNGVDLTVSEGETVAIMGRSGEGKSTLLHILGTLEKACHGLLEIAGKDIAHVSKTEIRNKHVGFVFQSFHLLDDYTALENILMPARIARCPIHKGSQAFNKGMELLDHVGLSNRAQFNTKQLSGGEKQRVAIARALCNNPDLILADEPSGNLDSQNAAVIHQLLLNFARANGKALIVVTHDQELANLCDTKYRMRDGKLVQ